MSENEMKVRLVGMMMQEYDLWQENLEAFGRDDPDTIRQINRYNMMREVLEELEIEV